MQNDIINAAEGLFTGIRLAHLPFVNELVAKKPEDILHALEAALPDREDAATRHMLTEAFQAYQDLLVSEEELGQRLKALDQLVAANTALAAYKEYFFDLLYVAWLSAQQEVGNEDWMDTPEWQQMEDKLAERGTEMLSMLMYLQEVRDSGLKATLDDFIDGYLGDDELEFQDDLEVYEEVITNREWLDLTYVEMVQYAEAMEEETAIPELFTPLFCFFKSPEKVQINILATLGAGGNLKRNLPVTICMLFFYKGTESISTFLRFSN